VRAPATASGRAEFLLVDLLACPPSPPPPGKLGRGTSTVDLLPRHLPACRTGVRCSHVLELSWSWKGKEQPAELNVNSSGCTSRVDTRVLHTQQQLSESLCRIHYHCMRNKDNLQRYLCYGPAEMGSLAAWKNAHYLFIVFICLSKASVLAFSPDHQNVYLRYTSIAGVSAPNKMNPT